MGFLNRIKQLTETCRIAGVKSILKHTLDVRHTELLVQKDINKVESLSFGYKEIKPIVIHRIFNYWVLIGKKLYFPPHHMSS